ncbi:MAG: glutaredoxin 3 [Polyangia bacterium]
MSKVEIYTTRFCPYCIMAKQLLGQKGVAYQETDVSGDDAARRMLRERTGRRTVPQIFINGKSVGGYDDIAELDRQGKLDPMLAAPAPASR